LVKSIGVSNWGTKHIQELLDAGSVLPVVNQIDLHPFMRHPDIVKICQDNGILLEVSLFLSFLSCMERRDADGRHGDHWQEQ
jgi:diketogulonate reductase-like aldo/keto reductase